MVLSRYMYILCNDVLLKKEYVNKTPCRLSYVLAEMIFL